MYLRLGTRSSEIKVSMEFIQQTMLTSTLGNELNNKKMVLVKRTKNLRDKSNDPNIMRQL